MVTGLSFLPVMPDSAAAMQSASPWVLLFAGFAFLLAGGGTVLGRGRRLFKPPRDTGSPSMNGQLKLDRFTGPLYFGAGLVLCVVALVRAVI